MPKMNFPRAFDLTLDDGEKVHFKAGMQNVPADLASHWFVKAMAEPDIDDADDDGMALLLAMAEELGIKVDKRWSEERLAAEIEKAEEAKKKADEAATGEGV